MAQGETVRRSGAFAGGTLLELLKDIWEKVNRDDCFGRAAELAFYFILALFPMLIFVTSVVGFVPGFQSQLIAWLSAVMPDEAMGLVHGWIEDMASNRSGGLLSFGFFGTLWAATTGVAALIAAINSAYEVEETRPYWMTRIVALILTLAITFFVVGGSMLLVWGDKLAEFASEWTRAGAVLHTVWAITDKVLGVLLLVLGISFIYFFAPADRPPHRLILPGALFAAVTFLGASYLFGLYLRVGPGYSATYGSLGAVVVLMMWLYIMGLAIFIGAEINATLERSSAKNRQTLEENH